MAAETSVARLTRRGVALIALFAGLHVTWLLLHPAPHAVTVAVNNVAQFAGLLLVLLFAAVSIARPGHRGSAPGAVRRWPAVLLALGALGDALGQMSYSYYLLVLHQRPPFPSWGDVFWLSEYPFLLLGILLLPARPLSPAARARVALDGLLVMVALGTCSWYAILGPTVLQGGETPLAKLVGTAYPASDLVLLACLLLLPGRAGSGVLRRVVHLVTAALVVIIATDSGFDYQTLHGGFATGSLLDAGWPLAYMLIGLAAALLPRTRVAADQATGPLARSDDAPITALWRLLLPYAPLPVVGALLLHAARTHADDRLQSGVYVGGATLVGLVVVRQIVALLENRRLSRETVAYARRTERLNADVTRAQGELRAVYGAMACGVLVRDAAGRLVDANAAAQQILGLPLDDMRGGTVAESRWAVRDADGASLPATERPSALALRTGQPQRGVTARLVRPDGAGRWLQVDAVPAPGPDGAPAQVVVSFIDISERVQAEGALRESEARKGAILEAALECIVTIDHEGNIIEFNPAAEKTFGYSRGEAIGREMAGLIIPPALRDQHRAGLARYLATGEGPVLGRRVELPALRADGSEFPVELAITRIPSDGPPLFTGYIRDITERKQVEEALRARMAAEQASAQKSEFLSRMSHELRTPMNAILGFAQLLRLDAHDPDQEQSVAHILKAGRHLLGLIDEVLDITHIEAGRMELSLEPIRLGDVVREAHDLVAPLAQGRGVRWDLGGLEDCDRHVRADRQRLVQVLLNLLSNAVKYNREGGTVTLSCAVPTPDRLRLVVRDTGMGLPEHKLGRLFTPFERLGAEASGVEGTGMGLALSRSLVAAMGGVIGVQSVEGQGSAFWIELDRTEAPAAQAARTGIDPPALHPAVERRTVLYIEDNLSNLQLTERLFAAQPQVALLSAMQGQRGLELARAHVPDLILLDVHLPDMLGDEVLRRLRGDPATRHIPVVVLSADATQRQKDRLADAGAQAYLTKPLDIAQFRRTVDALLQKEAS